MQGTDCKFESHTTHVTEPSSMHVDSCASSAPDVFKGVLVGLLIIHCKMV